MILIEAIVGYLVDSNFLLLESVEENAETFCYLVSFRTTIHKFQLASVDANNTKHVTPDDDKRAIKVLSTANHLTKKKFGLSFARRFFFNLNN